MPLKKTAYPVAVCLLIATAATGCANVSRKPRWMKNPWVIAERTSMPQETVTQSTEGMIAENIPPSNPAIRSDSRASAHTPAQREVQLTKHQTSGDVTPQDRVVSAPQLSWPSSDSTARETSPSLDQPLPPPVRRATDAELTQALPSPLSAEPSTFRDLSLNQTLQLAFASSPVVRTLGARILENPAGAATAYDVGITASDPFFGPQAALAQFDNVWTASLASANNDRVFNNVVVGGNAQQLVQDVATANVGVQKRAMSGALFDVRAINGYDANNRSGNLFPSYWDTQMEAGVRQPLLQGAGKQFNSIAGPNAQPGFNFSNGIIIAQMNTQVAAADFEIAIQRFTFDVQQAYWSLHRAYRIFEQKRQTRDVAYETWQSVRAKANQGLEGGQVDKEAQARQRYYRYHRAVLAAVGGGEGEAGLYEAERQLRHLIGLSLEDSALLRPVDAPPTAPVSYEWDSLVALSMVDRVELRRQNLKVRQQQLKLVASKNFLLPQLDLIGRYRARGFGDDLIGEGPRFASSYDDLFSLDHQELEFGVEWGITAGRRQARAAVRNAHLQLARERSILAEQQRELTSALNIAVARVQSLYATMAVGRDEQQAADDRMRATRVLYDVGKTDLFMLLDARETLLEVSERNIINEIAYAVALTDVAYQSGRILRDSGVGLASHQFGLQSNGCGPSMIETGFPKLPNFDVESN